MNMAPVLDIHTNQKNPVIGDRAFGRDHETVARMGIEAAKALHDEGIIAVGKHFPGHGDTSLDSHLDLPELPHDKARLKRVELKPFRAVIGSVRALMTAHVLYRGMDPLYPATLSRKILHDLLRRELRFSGVVISDDLMMKAITGRFEIGEAAVLAKNAGVDILLVCHSTEAAVRIFESLIRAVEKKEIPLREIDMSLNRILKLKERYL
jgi:beta-N-acetylhexosaminidase